MSTILDPSVIRKLRRFGRRRFQLLVIRGLCAGIVTFLICMAAIAVADWRWVLTDQTRWSLSVAGYVLTALAIWLTSLRRIAHTPDHEELATHVESAEPALRENLLSAVELATDDPSSVKDSPVFRSLLQGKVAEQMLDVKVGRLLPLRLMGKWMLAAVVVLAAVAAALNAPDSRFRTLALRAVLPGANVARVSRIQVEILQPSPASQTVARDETVGVAVAVSGGDVDEVILETQTADGETDTQLMRPRGTETTEANTPQEFVANIHVTSDATQYRIFAGDAITKRHTITAKDRPHVKSFEKTLRYPEYTGLPDSTVTEDHGDIVALQGTSVELKLQLDQPVETAELHIEFRDESEPVTIALEPADETAHSNSRIMRAMVPVTTAGLYRVHLVAKETRFENTFSPRYEIRPVPDLIPRAGFVGLTETDLLLPPNDLLALRGMGEDDLPLDILNQEFSINGGEWQSVPLDAKPASKTSDAEEPESASPETKEDPAAQRIEAAWDFDLVGLNLKTGDQVTTRLVAVDRQGNRGESVPIRIVISASSFRPERHATMQRKAAAYDSLVRFYTLAKEHKKTVDETVKRIQEELKKPADQRRTADERALDYTNLADSVQKTGASAKTVMEELHAVTRNMPAGTDAYDTELAARLLGQLALDQTAKSQWLLTKVATATNDNDTKKFLNEFRSSFDRFVDNARASEFHFRDLVTHNIVAAAAYDFDAMYRQQKLIAESPTQTWARLMRQQTVIMKQLAIVERTLEQQIPRIKDHNQNQFKSLLKWAQQRREQFDSATESEDKLPELQKLVQTMHREFRDRQRIDVSDGSLAERLNQARRDFDQRARSLVEPLSQMTEATHHINQLMKKAAAATDSKSAEDIATQIAAYETQITQHLQPSLEQLRVRRQQVQNRVDGDAQFAADAGLTARAVAALISQQRDIQANGPTGDETQDRFVETAFREIAPAFRVLEAGHAAKNVQLLLNTLVQLERWKSQDPEGIIDHPRQWDTVYRGLESAIQRMRQAGISNELMTKFDHARWSDAPKEVIRKIPPRRWQRDTPVSAAVDLAEFQQQLKQLDSELRPIMQTARETIAKYAPSISQLARNAAEEIRELEEQTNDRADAVEQNAAEPETPQMAELQQQQDAVNQQIDDLMEALVEDANLQDPNDPEQNERAKDADNSRALVQQPAEQMNDALEQAATKEQPEQQAKALAQAAEKQEVTAQALEQIADHFDRMENGEDIADSRAQLREQEQQLADNSAAAPAAQNSPDTQNADQNTAETPQSPTEQTAMTDDARELLAEAETPTDLLRNLEEELKRNPAMQQALAEISEKTVQEARNALEDAANRERQIQQANESSAKEFQQKKRELVQDLRELARDASQLSGKLVAQADSASAQAKTPEARQKFQEARNKLNEAAQNANSANEHQLQSQLQDKLNAAKQAINDAAKAISDAKDKSAEAKKEDIFNDDAKARGNAKKNLENQRKRFIDQLRREADNDKRRAESQERNLQNRLKGYERQVQQADRQLQNDKKRSAQKPDDQNLKRAVQRSETRKKQMQARVDAEKPRLDAAKEVTKAAREKRQDVDKLPRPALNEKNPAAQLAEQFGKEAEAVAKQLQQQAEELAQNSQFGNELTPSQQQLASATDQQQDVKQDVQETAENVARAARHERRLEKAATSQALQQAANDIEQLADKEVAQAETDLQAAGDAVAQAIEQQKQSQQAAEAAKNAQPSENDPAQADAKANQQANANANANTEEGQDADAQADAEQKAAAAQQVAQQKADAAQQKADAAQQKAAESQASAQQKSGQASKSLANSEAAIEQQAKDLTGILEPMQQANAEAAQSGEASAAASAENQSENSPQNSAPEMAQNSGEQNAANQNAPAKSNQNNSVNEQNSQQPTGQQTAAANSPSGNQQPSGQSNSQPPGQPAKPQSFTPEEMATGRQLAQALDELDRMQASPDSALAQQLPQAQATAAQQQQAQARSQSQQATALTPTTESAVFDPTGIPAYEGSRVDAVDVVKVNRIDGEDWGQLRRQDAGDVSTSTREAVAAEYRQSVQAYFRVLAERARRKSK